MQLQQMTFGVCQFFPAQGQEVSIFYRICRTQIACIQLKTQIQSGSPAASSVDHQYCITYASRAQYGKSSVLLCQNWQTEAACRIWSQSISGPVHYGSPEIPTSLLCKKGEIFSNCPEIQPVTMADGGYSIEKL